MSGYNGHSGLPYSFNTHHQGFHYGSPQAALAHYTGQHQVGGHQATLQAGNAYSHSGHPSVTYPISIPAQMPVLPPTFMPQTAIHAPSSSPGPAGGDRPSTPDLPPLPQLASAKDNLRTSPRSNKGVAPARVPQTVAQRSGPKSNPKDASKTAPSAPQNPPGKSNKASPTVKAEDDDLKNKAWTDDEVTTTFRYLFGDFEDGDIGEGKYKEWQKNKSHWNRKMSTELFGGKRAHESIKSKLDRSMKIYKYMVIFEDHTGGGGDGDDDGMSESQKIKVKLDSVRKAGKDVGNITVVEIEKWRTLGWYKMIDRCLGASQNVRRKTTISSVNAPSPFNENDNGDAEQGAEDAELILSDDDESSVNGKAIIQVNDADNEETGGAEGEGEKNEGEMDNKTPTQPVPKKGEKKRAGPTSTKGVEEPPHKKKKSAAAASVDTTEFLAANAEFFRSRVDIDERSLQLKEKQYKTSTELEKKKVRIDLAQNILANDKLDDERELREHARETLLKALKGD